MAARARGFTPVVRAAGGRAAAYDEGSLVLDELIAGADAMRGISERFAADAERQATALRTLGIDARVGQVPGEYCAGEYTVNARGVKKLIGAAQRVIRGGWLFSSVVVVDGSDRLRAVLQDVYAALGLDWNPATVGAISDEAPGNGLPEVRAALLDAYADRFALRPASLPPEVVAIARQHLGNHSVDEKHGATGW
jgi:lipoate-protein ligase A